MNRQWIICAALFAAALTRLTGVAPAVLPNQDSAIAVGELLDRENFSKADLSNLPNVAHVQPMRFDPLAKVLLGTGQDGAAGQEDQDDDFDGVIDNPLEMGAVGSDDQCVAPWSDDYAKVSRDEASIPISTGAYVFDADATERFIVHYKNENHKWAWTIVPSS